MELITDNMSAGVEKKRNTSEAFARICLTVSQNVRINWKKNMEYEILNIILTYEFTSMFASTINI